MLGVLDLKSAFIASLANGAAANGTGTGVLIGGGGVPTNLILSIGAGGGSATVTVEESDDNATNWVPLLEQDGTTPVSFAVVAGSANTIMKKIAQRGAKYLRAKQAGVSGAAPLSLLVISGAVYAAAPGKQGGFQVTPSAAPSTLEATKKKGDKEDDEEPETATAGKGKGHSGHK